VAGTNGNRFTPEDKDFFLKCISWELSKDPSQSRAEVCTTMAEKASRGGHYNNE
jgi:hypothetical protein